jgi:hypothetical protein
VCSIIAAIAATANFAVARSGTIRFVTARQQPDGSWLVIEESTGP